MVDQAIKDYRYEMNSKFEMKRVPLDPRDHSYEQLAFILETPNKLAGVKNGYHSFKKLGNINLPGFLHKRQDKANRIDKMLNNLKTNVIAKLEEEKRAERRANQEVYRMRQSEREERSEQRQTSYREHNKNEIQILNTNYLLPTGSITPRVVAQNLNLAASALEGASELDLSQFDG